MRCLDGRNSSSRGVVGTGHHCLLEQTVLDREETSCAIIVPKPWVGEIQVSFIKRSMLFTCFALLPVPVSHAAEGIETILVTAQKRTEDVQDVAISMEVISGDELEKLRVKTFEDLQQYVPNFTVQPTPGANQIYIRGIGSGAQNFAFEQAVSLYVDGIYAGRNRQFMAPFFDIERIEILRGPQGALLGKNTAAGAISLVSAQPTEEFEGYVDAAFLLDRGGVDLSGVGGLSASAA